jgi:hypothetical protein
MSRSSFNGESGHDRLRCTVRSRLYIMYTKHEITLCIIQHLPPNTSSKHHTQVLHMRLQSGVSEIRSNSTIRGSRTKVRPPLVTRLPRRAPQAVATLHRQQSYDQPANSVHHQHQTWNDGSPAPPQRMRQRLLVCHIFPSPRVVIVCPSIPRQRHDELRTRRYGDSWCRNYWSLHGVFPESIRTYQTREYTSCGFE